MTEEELRAEIRKSEDKIRAKIHEAVNNDMYKALTGREWKNAK